MPYMTIRFIVKGEEIYIQGKNNEYMKDIFKKFGIKLNEDTSNYLFLYKGTNVNQNLTLEELIGDDDKDITILAYDDKINKTTFLGAKYIICPVCKKDCVIKIKDYKINLEECDEDHNSSNILLEKIESYKNNQLIDQSKIICSICNAINKCITYDNKFYKCMTCSKYICPLCKIKHVEINHNIIDYDEINFICNEHYPERYNSYCTNCRKNLCLICEKKHKDHSRISFGDIIPDNNNLKIDEFEKTLNEFKNDIIKLKEILNKVEDNMDIYLEMINEIKNYYNIRNRNYQILQSVNNICSYNDILINNMKKIINKKDLIDKFKDLFEIYNLMTKKNAIKNELNNRYTINNNNNSVNINNTQSNNSHINSSSSEYKKSQSDKLNNRYPISNTDNDYSESNNNDDNDKLEIISQLNEAKNNSFTNVKKKKGKIDKTNELILKYINNKNEKDINLLGDKFISNNKDKCHIFFNGKQQDLRKSYNKRKFNITNNILEVKLIFSSQLIDMSTMFKDCQTLISIKNIDRIDTSKVTNMNHLFCGCSSLQSLPDISIWDTSKVTNMRYMFGDCSSLKELPDISEWDTSNVTNLSCFLCECKEIIELPDISKWNISKVTDLSSMFCGCLKLSKIPNFQKWDVRNVTNASYMFNRCSSLSKNIISQFNFKDGVNKDYFF